MKQAKSQLLKLEQVIQETDYILRYEKGQFQSNFCLLRDKKVILVNKFLPPAGRVLVLQELIQTLEFDLEQLSEKSQTLIKACKKIPQIKQAQLARSLDRKS